MYQLRRPFPAFPWQACLWQLTHRTRARLVIHERHQHHRFNRDGTSRRIFIIESDGEIFVASGYMNSMMGKLWKDWAYVEKGNKDAVIRINNVRYERQLERVTGTEASEGAARARRKIWEAIPLKRSPR